MCRHCETKCSSKQTKQCPKTRVICSLPYPITKSGHYCLGKDFQWSDAAQSAITVSADNVVLDFNHRIITTDVASDVPLVSVTGSTDVELKNVHLKGVGAGKYLRGGISVLGCKNVVVDSPVLLNLMGKGANEVVSHEELLVTQAFGCASTVGLEIFNLYLKNDEDTTVITGIFFDDVSGLVFRDSQYYNAKARGYNSQNVDFLRLHVDNTRFTTEEDLFLHGVQLFTQDTPFFKTPLTNVRIADCNIKVRGFGVSGMYILTSSSPDGTSNVLIENNVINVVNGFRGIRLDDVTNGIIRGNSISLKVETTSVTYGMQLTTCNAISITKNNIQINSLNPNLPDGSEFLGIAVFQIFPIGKASEAMLIAENNIHKSGFTNLTSGFAEVGILFISLSPLESTLRYNTIDRNNVTGFIYGITDGDVNFSSDFNARCNIYSNNFSNGNGQNYFIDTSDPVNSIFLGNNVKGCVNPDLVPLAARAVELSDSVKSKLELRMQRYNRFKDDQLR